MQIGARFSSSDLLKYLDQLNLRGCLIEFCLLELTNLRQKREFIIIMNQQQPRADCMSNLSKSLGKLKEKSRQDRNTNDKESILIELPSKTYKVNPNDELLDEIHQLTHVQPMLNQVIISFYLFLYLEALITTVFHLANPRSSLSKVLIINWFAT